jgi:TRAP-type uncharacterized transport system substrate-binding protein
MRFDTLATLSRRDLWRIGLPVLAVTVAAFWLAAHLLQPAPPRHIVLASGAEGGMYHRHAQRYREILARDGVTVEERMTNGSGDNLQLLRDPKSGIDVALVQGGIATEADGRNLVAIATLYYEPLWVFYRGAETVTRLNQLAGKRIAVGVAGSGARAFALPLLAANGVDAASSDLREQGGSDAIGALRAGEVDAVFLMGPPQAPAVRAALYEPGFRLMNFVRAEAYARRFPYITRLTLPPGALDFARNLPEQEVTLIGTTAMLVARSDFHPALMDLLLDAADDIHGGQGYFERAGEFPGIRRIDLPIADEADRYHRHGPTFLHRYLPFWVAGLIERLVILLIPLFVVGPLLNALPQLIRWRARSRIYRWYGELAFIERDVETRAGTLPIDKWLQDIDRIERSVEHISTAPSFASELYTLREHVALVRRAVLRKVSGEAPSG